MAADRRQVQTEIIPYLFYRDVAAALDWLARAFGFTEAMREATPRGGVHGEMIFGGRRIMMGQGAAELKMLSVAETQVATQGVFIYLDDVDAQLPTRESRRRRDRKPPEDSPHGTQLYGARP